MGLSPERRARMVASVIRNEAAALTRPKPNCGAPAGARGHAPAHRAASDGALGALLHAARGAIPHRGSARRADSGAAWSR
jgi:hypothetical protein